jgi:hypothetical protein
MAQSVRLRERLSVNWQFWQLQLAVCSPRITEIKYWLVQSAAILLLPRIKAPRKLQIALCCLSHSTECVCKARWPTTARSRRWACQGGAITVPNHHSWLIKA